MSSNPFAQGPAAFGFTGAEAPTDYWDNYQTAGKGGGPLPAGRYTFQVPDPGDDYKPTRTKNGAFALSMHPKVSRGEFAGRQLRFVTLSAQKSEYRDGSMAGDLLHAVGIAAAPKTVDEWFAVAPFLAGKEFDADVDLDVYDSVTGTTLFRRAADLPKKADGSPKTVIVLRADGTPVHNPADEQQERAEEEAVLANGGRKVFANNKIRRIYPVS